MMQWIMLTMEVLDSKSIIFKDKIFIITKDMKKIELENLDLVELSNEKSLKFYGGFDLRGGIVGRIVGEVLDGIGAGLQNLVNLVLVSD